MAKQFQELTDSQWAAISEFFDNTRKRTHNLRVVLNAILYMVRVGCQWRNLPPHYPNWRAVNYYFEKWKKDNTLNSINEKLNRQDREANGKEATPSLLCIDSQSLKLTPMIYEHRGLDPNKKVNGRKRQFLVDTDGRLYRVLAHAANINDGKGAQPLLNRMETFNERLEKIVGDDAYAGAFADAVSEKKLVFEKGSKPESVKGFVPIAKRWVVERTIAWTNFFRRLVKDYEYTPLSSAAWSILANITIMLQRMKPIPN